jgi:hypothetical protein
MLAGIGPGVSFLEGFDGEPGVPKLVNVAATRGCVLWCLCIGIVPSSRLRSARWRVFLVFAGGLFGVRRRP